MGWILRSMELTVSAGRSSRWFISAPATCALSAPSRPYEAGKHCTLSLASTLMMRFSFRGKQTY